MANDPQNEELTSKHPLSFDEYKLYYETTEKVTERRIAANRWNYSVCIAIIVAISALVAWCSSRPTFFTFAVVAVAIFSTCGALFCGYWLSEIRSAKLLNAAKFAVLNEMAKQVVFEDGKLRSFEPFAKEWDLVVANEGARSIRGLRGRLALSSSGAELFTPRVFRGVFLAIGVGTVASALVAVAVPPSRPYLPLSPTAVPVTQVPSGVAPSLTTPPPARP